MSGQAFPTYYLSAALAIVGTVGYHTFVKTIPPMTDPMVSVIGIYTGVLLIGLILLPFVYSGERIAESVRQLGWVQVGIAICIVMIELGFILMYRNGWDLSVGNALTSAVINLVLMLIGTAVLRETLSLANLSGILLCIAGVVLTGIRS